MYNGKFRSEHKQQQGKKYIKTVCQLTQKLLINW